MHVGSQTNTDEGYVHADILKTYHGGSITDSKVSVQVIRCIKSEFVDLNIV